MLDIIIQGTNCTDQFELNEFYIETDTFVEAGPSDNEAWSTDPARWDTDGDGWSDKYEIYDRQEPTNPLSEDTDGDGAWDSYDRDPIRDLIIEISPNYGWHRNLFFWEASPLLEIVISFSLSGSEYFFCSTMQQASEDQEHIFIWPFWHYYHYRKAYFNGSSGSTELNYYANFDDDIRIQGNTLNLNIELWRMGPNDVFGNPLWDIKILDQTETYIIENEMEFTSTQTGLFGFQNEVQIEVNTVGLEKANIIAIYDNETVFNGHYQQQERMNIIQLYVNDDTSLESTPFVEGPNAIVIPTSLFLETILNKKVQDELLNETALYAKDKCEFISIERNGETEEACEDVDFVFVRFDISGEDAMEVLNMLLTCLVNDSTNETAISYKYFSTKHNGTSAVLMNLPSSALGFVPWLCNYENSAQGRIPHDFGEWLLDKLKDIGEFFVGIFVAIWTAITAIWEAVTEFIGEILMDAIQWIAYMIWLLLRAVIFILVWILFAIVIFCFILFIALLFLVLLPITLLNGGELNYQINKVNCDLFGTPAEFGFEIFTEYIPFFDFWVPYSNFYINLNNSRLLEFTVKFWLPEISFNIGDDTDPESSSMKQNLIIRNSKSNDQFNHLNNSRLKSSTPYIESLNNVDACIAGLDDGFGAWSSLLLIFMSLCFIRSFYIKRIVHIVVLTLSIIASIVGYYLSQYTNEQALLYFIGAGVSSLITAAFFLLYYQKKNSLDIHDVFGSFESLLKNFEFGPRKVITEFVLDTIECVFDLIGMFGGDIGDIVQYLADVYFTIESVKDWMMVMLFVPSWGKMLPVSEDRDSDVLAVALSPIVTGIFLIVIGICIYNWGNNE